MCHTTKIDLPTLKYLTDFYPEISLTFLELSTKRFPWMHIVLLLVFQLDCYNLSDALIDEDLIIFSKSSHSFSKYHGFQVYIP